MILINIDSLSTTELQYIAQQEGLENWQTLDREKLIDELEEAYGEQDDDISSSATKNKANRKRFCNALTDFRGNMQNVQGLPGVERSSGCLCGDRYPSAFERPCLGICLLVSLPRDKDPGFR